MRWPLMRFSALIGRTRGQRCALTDLRARLRPFLGLCFKKIWASVSYLTSGRKPYRQTQGDVKGMPMLAWIIGIVVAIGLIWSVAAMSNLAPVGPASASPAIPQPAEYLAPGAAPTPLKGTAPPDSCHELRNAGQVFATNRETESVVAKYA